MVQRACIFAADKADLLRLFKTDSKVHEIVARFRPSFLLADENKAALKELNYNSVVHIHNSWPSSLTFGEGKEPLSESEDASALFVESKASPTWILNIDCWFLLPEEYEKKLIYMAPHVYCFNNTSVIETI